MREGGIEVGRERRRDGGEGRREGGREEGRKGRGGNQCLHSCTLTILEKLDTVVVPY